MSSSAHQNNIYLQRINRVIDYIYHHLTEDLTLSTLAGIADFSPYHFHRIFSTIIGESLNKYVVRVRLERAASLMKASPNEAIANIAYSCGFSSPSDFSRSFKKHFGLPAREWDRKTMLKNEGSSKIWQALERFRQYLPPEGQRIIEDEYHVEIRSVPAQRVAYIRIIDSYTEGKLDTAYEKLWQWIDAQQLPPGTFIGMTWDDPEVVPLEQCRYDICVTVADDVEGGGEVSVRTLPACTMALIHSAGNLYVVDKAWRYLYEQWLPRSSWQPDNLPAMEVYHSSPRVLDWNNFNLDCCIPVVALP